MPGKKKRGAGKTDAKHADAQTMQGRQRGYLVRFPDPEAEKRAILILGEVGLPYSGYPDEKYGVQYGLMNKHIEAANEKRYPMKWWREDAGNGKTQAAEAASLQSGSTRWLR